MSEAGIYVATFIGRLVLGILFFYQGYDKVFRVGVSNVISASQAELASSGFPPRLIKLGAWFNSYVELLCGLLLIVGLLKIYALSLLGINMILVAAGMSSVNPFWKSGDFFPRLALLLFQFYAIHDPLSADFFLK